MRRWEQKFRLSKGSFRVNILAVIIKNNLSLINVLLRCNKTWTYIVNVKFSEVFLYFINTSFYFFFTFLKDSALLKSCELHQCRVNKGIPLYSNNKRTRGFHFCFSIIEKMLFVLQKSRGSFNKHWHSKDASAAAAAWCMNKTDKLVSLLRCTQLTAFQSTASCSDTAPAGSSTCFWWGWRRQRVAG